MTTPLCETRDLWVSANGKEILRGVDLIVDKGEWHALMGPNGAGKSTLAKVLMGDPTYTVTRGKVFFEGEDITRLPSNDRARRGMFLSFQHPEQIPGVKVVNFMQIAMSHRQNIDLSMFEVRLALMEKMRELNIDNSFMDRHLNVGFSGGERKRHEILQMSLLSPHLVILDETDSGLDVDALRVVSDGITAFQKDSPQTGGIIITHYKRILQHIRPTHVHVLVEGRIIASGGFELATQIDTHGFERYLASERVSP